MLTKILILLLFIFLAADYPYCLVNKELRSIIKSLLLKAGGVLELFFDHCIYTMLQELDKTPGKITVEYRSANISWDQSFCHVGRGHLNKSKNRMSVSFTCTLWQAGNSFKNFAF